MDQALELSNRKATRNVPDDFTALWDECQVPFFSPESVGIVMLSREEHYGQCDDSDKDDETDADGFDRRNFSMSLRFLKEDIFILNFNWILRRIGLVNYGKVIIHKS